MTPWRALPTVLLLGALPLAAQTEPQYEASIASAINSLEASLQANFTPPPNQKIVFGANAVAAYGTRLPSVKLPVALDYIDGLKAAGVQRVEFNPGVDSMFQPDTVAKYDAIVQHIRQLGMQLGINPEYENGEISETTGEPFTSFAEFQTQQLQSYQMLASRYQPDNFVLLHEPDTMTGRLGLKVQPQEWYNFVTAAGPIVKAASPHTRVGVGSSYNTALNDYNAENAYFEYFASSANYPACTAALVAARQACLDFMTMDIYSTSFSVFESWAQLAHANGKGVYIEEVWTPQDLPNPLPAGTGESLDQLSLIGPVCADFQNLDNSWLQAMVQFASDYGMESVTPFTTEAFFYYGTVCGNNSGADDKPSDNSTYWPLLDTALVDGQLTSTGQAWLAQSQKMAIPQAVSLNSASFPTLPTVFDPTCGTATNPCNPLSVVAPGSLASAFGADLAKATIVDGSFPTTLGGTTMTLVDSSNTTYQLPLYLVSPTQVNYYVPPQVESGPATVSISSPDGTVTTGWMLVAPVAPGLYTANQNGQGVASGIAICAGTCAGWPNPIGNSQFYQYTFMAGSAGEVPVPLSVAAGDTVVVELFGTGIRNVPSLGAVTATINGQNAPVLYAGAQNVYQGLDQVNVQIPNSLAGSGAVQAVLSVEGAPATLRPVTLDIQ